MYKLIYVSVECNCDFQFLAHDSQMNPIAIERMEKKKREELRD